MTASGHFDVVGASAALGLFGSLDAVRLGHGYLFTGPSGVGKKTFARRLAQSLLCETPKTTLLGYCNACTGCTLFTAGTHPDFFESLGQVRIGDRDGRAGIGEEITSRDLVRALGLHAYRAAWRVLLLGDVEFATHEAANALLKFFEEPPAGVLVMLTTDAPGSLLATIRSRFVEVPFRSLTSAEIAGTLERDGVPQARAQDVARTALGSLTAARAMVDEGGTTLRNASFGWFADAVAGRPPDATFLRLEDRDVGGAEKRALVGSFVGFVRTAARDWAAIGLADDVPLLAEDERGRLHATGKRGPRETAALLGAIADAQRLADTNVSPALIVDFLRMQLAPPNR